MDITGANIFKNSIGTFSGLAAFIGLSCKICEYTQAGQIERSVANGLPPLVHFFGRSCVAHRRDDMEMAPQTQHTLYHNKASTV